MNIDITTKRTRPLINRVIKGIRFILINLFTFTILLFLVNVLCGLIFKNTPPVTRDQLPNYANDPAYARQIFKDYNSVKHHYEPFVAWKCLPYKGKTLTINEAGERIHTVYTGSDDHSRVVRFFGGSTMWGEGSDDQHTIPALFHKKHPETRVYNHAQLAYNTRQELDALISLYSKNEKADVVIFYDGVNDAAFLCPTEIDELPAHRLVPLYRSKLYVPKTAMAKELLSSLFTDNLMRAITRKSNAESNPAAYNCLSDSAKAEEIAEIMMKNWELAREIVTNRGGQFIAILQPAALVGYPKTDHLAIDPVLKENFAEVYKHIRRKIQQRKHNWIYDLSDSFNRNEYIYIDFCHVSPNGNEIIAEAIARIYADELKLP